MAGGDKILFPHEISSYNALDWSEDGTVAIATDNGVLLLTLQWSPTLVDSKPIFHQSMLTYPDEPNNMLGLTVLQYETIQNDSTTCQSQEIALDRTICPIIKSTTKFTTFKCAKWSPRGGDIEGKCLLSTLTLDHRLSLYSTGKINTEFKLLVELSSVYSDKAKLENLTFNCLKTEAYRISAVEMSWSPVIALKDNKFSILSVGMSNGDIVLWKVKFPCTGREDCSVITVLKISSGLPSAMTWCNRILTGNVACCIVGFDLGIIKAISVNVNMPNKTTTVNLCEQSDGMKVTTVSAKSIDADKITILATKEIFILSYEVEVIYKILRLFSSSHTTGDYNYFASGLSYNNGRYLLSSCDGTILKFSEDKISQSLLVTYKHAGDLETTWSCYGIAWSSCGLFSIAAFKPANICEDRQVRPGTLEVQILPVDVDSQKETLKNYLLNEQSLNEIPECMEVFRENLWEGNNPLQEINDLFRQEGKWFDFSSKVLRVLRYFLLAVQMRIPHSDKEKNEELVLSERNISKISDILLCKHLIICLNKAFNLKSKLQNNDLIVLQSMINWMDSKHELIKSTLLLHTISKIKAVLKNFNHTFKCCICDNKFSLEGRVYKCEDGHIFGMCCQTTLPCQYSVRTCSTCSSVATSIDEISSLPWLDVKPSQCTFCDGFLV
ncbi:general transcription factor 3C polypeptide 4-like [Mytilus trossulus]|uniref:general transcription factor 3C polypeptide 4-like n=1 Tax=Mytilus trossulus TaxID=6551 RepID=UPI0030041827